MSPLPAPEPKGVPSLQDSNGNTHTHAQRLGIVTQGSLTKGIDVKLDGEVSIEEIAVGRFVTIQGASRRFFGVITDVTLAHTDDRLAQNPPDVSDPFIAQVISGTAAYGQLHVTPYLVLGADVEGKGPLPAKTVPPHFALVRTSDPKEVQLIFGDKDDKHIWIGSPLDMEEAPVCLDIDRLTERSVGVFGKTGTGKSFLTRIVLAEIVQKAKVVSLIFDMHSEYGWSHRSESKTEVKGLKQLFPSKVAVFTLDEAHTRGKGASADYVVQIPFDEVSSADIGTLAGVLNLNETQVQLAERFERKYKRGWLTRFINAEDLTEYASGSEHEGSVDALHRKLQKLSAFDFLKEKTPDDTVKRIIEYLDRGTHVVLEFGKYRNNLSAYILVANLLTRRIHEKYVERTEAALGKKGAEPNHLIIAIEEAHKFLSPSIAHHTAFATIARELRKYNVTLLIIDQRPSGIDTEVLSQVGTKITCLLEDEKDIDAVLAGQSGARELRAVLSKLETKQQALIFGHAVPMPVVVRTRTYDKDFYASLGILEDSERKARAKKDAEELFR